MAENLAVADRMLLATVIDHLREEPAPRPLEWLLRRLAGTDPLGRLTLIDSVVQVPALWNRLFRDVRVLQDIQDSGRLLRLIPIALQEGWLTESNLGEYESTPAGHVFSEREYRRCGETEGDDLLGAEDVCRALAQAGTPLTERALQAAVFPSNIGGAQTVGVRVMLAAREAAIPGRMRGALTEARGRGWIQPLAEGPTAFPDPNRRWALTEAGRREGAAVHDAWR